MEDQTTYRDEVQRMISDLQDLYDRAAWLRDRSGYEIGGGKREMNQVRTVLPKVWSFLQALDEEMPDYIATQQLKNWKR
jgi:hypothetical protein